MASSDQGCYVKPTVHKTAFHNLVHRREREREKEGGGGRREGKYLDYTYKNEEDVYADLQWVFLGGGLQRTLYF